MLSGYLVADGFGILLNSLFEVFDGRCRFSQIFLVQCITCPLLLCVLQVVLDDNIEVLFAVCLVLLVDLILASEDNI